MPKILFKPSNAAIEFQGETKLLTAAVKAKTNIRYGCSACRCGTCGVKVDATNATLKSMHDDEKALLEKMGLTTDGSVRLACQTRVIDGELIVDLDFQDTYSPDDFPEEY